MNAIERANARGHSVKSDPPAAMTAARRWTCERLNCSGTVIDYRGNIYGSAVERDCPVRWRADAAKADQSRKEGQNA